MELVNHILFWAIILILCWAWSRSQQELTKVRNDRDAVKGQRNSALDRLRVTTEALERLRAASQDLREANHAALRDRDRLLQYLSPVRETEEAPEKSSKARTSAPRTSIWDLL